MSTATERVITIDPAKVRPFADQPREYFDRDELISLELSIKNRGHLQPGIVKPLQNEDHEYELVDGQRRWHACMHLKVPFRAVVMEVADEDEQFEISIASNFQRAEHTPMEIAKAIDRLCTRGKCTEGYVAVLFGKSAAWVNTMRRLVDLCPEAQKLIEAPTPERERLPLSVAQVLARLSKSEQVSMLDTIRRKKLSATAAAEKIRKRLIGKGEIQQNQLQPSHHGRKIEGFVQRTIKGVEDILSRLTPELAPRVSGSLRDLGRLTNMRTSIRTAIERLEVLDGKFGAEPPRNTKPAPTEETIRSHDSSLPRFVHSHELKCPKCQKTTRFQRRRDADPQKDSWVCLKTGCMIRIAHVTIKEDRNFKGAA